MHDSDSFFDVVTQQWPAILDAYKNHVPLDGYLHWDEINQQPDPDGLSCQASWAALKLARSAGLKAIPLADLSGRSFEFSVPSRVAEILHQIDRSDANAGGMSDGPERFLADALRMEAVGSAVLAGATAVQATAEEMLRCGRQPGDRSERMIFNLHRALEKVRGLRSTGLSPAIIFDLHRCVTEGTLDTVDASGRLRREGEISALRGPAASEHEFPPAAELGRRLESMCAFANGETPAFFVHPVVRAVLLHFWLAYEHPFVDGNGRAARILFHWAALRQGYPVFAYLAISPVLMQDPASYMLAFRHTETDDNDLTYFLLHQAAAIQTAMAAFFDRTTRIACERNATKAGLPGFAALNSRQQALIAHAIRRPEARYGIVGHQRSHGVTHQTARDDLFDLTRRELLTVGKEGRTYFFQAAADLPRKLRSAVGRRRAAAVVLSGELPTNLL